MEVEKDVQSKISEIREDLRQTNWILTEAVAEMRKANEKSQQLVGTIASCSSRQHHEFNLPSVQFTLL